MPKSKKKSLIYVFDADGCIFNSNFGIDFHLPDISPGSITKLIDKINSSNEDLFHSIQEKITQEKPDEVVVMCGSSRQSHFDDIEESRNNRTPSFFITLFAIKELIRRFEPRVKLDGFLMADVYQNSPPGTEFNKAVGLLYTQSINRPVDDNLPIDSSKQLNILALSHYLSAIYNEMDEIIVNFCDAQETRLDRLNDMFSRNPILIPRNIKLNLIHHDGVGLQELLHVISGTGYFKHNYQNIINHLSKKLMSLCGESRHIDGIKQSKNHRNDDRLVSDLINAFSPTLNISRNLSMLNDSDYFGHPFDSEQVSETSDNKYEGGEHEHKSEKYDSVLANRMMIPQYPMFMLNVSTQKQDATIQTHTEHNDVAIQTVSESYLRTEHSGVETQTVSESCCCCHIDWGYFSAFSWFSQSSAQETSPNRPSLYTHESRA